MAAKPRVLTGGGLKRLPVDDATARAMALAKSDLIVLPEYEEYLAHHPNVEHSEAVAKRIYQLMTTKPRDRSRSFSASSAGLCKRRQELSFLGVERSVRPSAREAAIFRHGTWLHLKWQATLLEIGVLDGVEITVRHPTLPARADLDGIGDARRGRWAGEMFTFEFKGRNTWDFGYQESNGEPDIKTQKQKAFQTWLSHAAVASVVNENKNDQTTAEFLVEPNEPLMRAVETDVREMTRAIEKGHLHDMLPECQKRLKGGEFPKCPFGTEYGACVASGSWPSGTR